VKNDEQIKVSSSPTKDTFGAIDDFDRIPAK
jgi:hypothetical protein